EPLGVCNIAVKGKGKFYISSQDVIEVNKQIEPPQPPTPEENGGGGGGGSTSPFMLALMAVAAGLRRFLK
ncbi:GlyGly-CTERM sorting domain-containing protein, partial [Klebsiella pneumoniae]